MCEITVACRFESDRGYMKNELIPKNAHSIEVFAIKNGEAFIGFKIRNYLGYDDFHYVQVPYTEKKK